MSDKTARLVKEWESNWDDVIAQARDLKTAGATMLRLATELRTAPDGYPRSSIGTGIAPSGPSDRTGEMATNVEHLDRVDQWLDNFFAADIRVRGDVDLMERLVWLVEHRKDQRAGAERNDGHCKACVTRYVPGSSTDRLRNELCDACYQAWRRWREPEIERGGDASKTKFLAERRTQLHIDAEGHCLDCGKDRQGIDHDLMCKAMRREAG